MASLIPKLKPRWSTLMSRLRVRDSHTQQWFSTVCTKYTEPQRHYHTLTHIDELFVYFDKHERDIKKHNHVELAIWFHDVIYDPKKNNNEEESAKLFSEFCDEALELTGISSELKQTVTDYILATKSHKMPNPNDTDLAYFLDFDMTILGKPWDFYKIYSQQIRQEYIHYPEKDYCVGRTKVLNSLKSGGIYISDPFKKEYEERAKLNMEKEIEELQEQLKQL